LDEANASVKAATDTIIDSTAPDSRHLLLETQAPSTSSACLQRPSALLLPPLAIVALSRMLQLLLLLFGNHFALENPC